LLLHQEQIHKHHFLHFVGILFRMEMYLLASWIKMKDRILL
jgi:hypothetical protein